MNHIDLSPNFPIYFLDFTENKQYQWRDVTGVRSMARPGPLIPRSEPGMPTTIQA